MPYVRWQGLETQHNRSLYLSAHRTPLGPYCYEFGGLEVDPSDCSTKATMVTIASRVSIEE